MTLTNKLKPKHIQMMNTETTKKRPKETQQINKVIYNDTKKALKSKYLVVARKRRRHIVSLRKSIFPISL